MQNPSVLYPRSIRSFVCRSKKLPPFLKTRWDALWPLYGLSLSEPGHRFSEGDDISHETTFNWDAIFKRKSDRILDIGFGDGEALIKMASLQQDTDFIGVEMYQKGIAKLLSRIESSGLQNIRIFCADATEVLTKAIAKASLTKVQIFFADPWPKTRHHKRRLIQSPFVALLAEKLQPGGVLHLATDDRDYAHHMMSVISPNPKLENICGVGKFSSRPADRPFTKYEQRGIRLGNTSQDLLFRRIGL